MFLTSSTFVSRLWLEALMFSPDVWVVGKISQHLSSDELHIYPKVFYSQTSGLQSDSDLSLSTIRIMSFSSATIT